MGSPKNGFGSRFPNVFRLTDPTQPLWFLGTEAPGATGGGLWRCRVRGRPEARGLWMAALVGLVGVDLV